MENKALVRAAQRIQVMHWKESWNKSDIRVSVHTHTCLRINQAWAHTALYTNSSGDEVHCNVTSVFEVTSNFEVTSSFNLTHSTCIKSVDILEKL